MDASRRLVDLSSVERIDELVDASVLTRRARRNETIASSIVHNPLVEIRSAAAIVKD